MKVKNNIQLFTAALLVVCTLIAMRSCITNEKEARKLKQEIDLLKSKRL
jgi:hypothetical protein